MQEVIERKGETKLNKTSRDREGHRGRRKESSETRKRQSSTRGRVIEKKEEQPSSYWKQSRSVQVVIERKRETKLNKR